MPQFRTPGPLGLLTTGVEFGGRLPGPQLARPPEPPPPAFPNIDPTDLYAGVAARKTQWGLIAQRGTPLCGPASFMYLMAKHTPDDYERFVTELYETGESAIGKLRITPGDDCKNFDPTGKMNAADWVALAGLKDSENWVFDVDDISDWFLPDAVNGIAGITIPATLSGWFRDQGLFAEVINDTNLYFTKGEANWDRAQLLRKQGYEVCLFVRATIIDEPPFNRFPLWQPITIPNHWVVLTSDVRRVRDELSFTVFSWGDGASPVPTAGVMTMSQWLDNYYGFVAVR